MTDKQDLANIFIWGNVGEKLKGLDAERLMAIAQSDPNYYLSVIANDELDDMIRVLVEKGELTDDIEKAIRHTNKMDNIFREIAEFLHESEDMLSTGSFIVGEVEEKTALLRLIKGTDKHG